MRVRGIITIVALVIAGGCATGESAIDEQDKSFAAGASSSAGGDSANAGSAGDSSSGGASAKAGASGAPAVGGGTSAGGASSVGGAMSQGGTSPNGGKAGSSGNGGTSASGSGGASAAGNGGTSSGATGGMSAAGSGGTGTAGSSANPCAGITCAMPPPNACVDANTLGVFSAMGTCDAGKCSYAMSTTPCSAGCANGQCTGDPCVGVTCAMPPASTCADAQHLTVYDSPGSCSDGKCSYSSHQSFCSFGCMSNVCNGDPCTGMTCKSPPVSYCADPSNLVVFQSPGTCAMGACSYTSEMQFCAHGCVNGGCMSDPCAGVTCSTPPSSYCGDAMTLKSYASSGTCANGTCSYAETDKPCAHGCVNGKCEDCSIDTDCMPGNYCNGGTCTTCGVDQHCGSSCTDCSASSEVCSNGSCVQCKVDGDCGAGSGKFCSSGICTACQVDAHCGASCAACSGTTPTCNGSTCVCGPSSCAANSQCVSGACAVCASDSACGASCTACGGTTPKCLGAGSTSSCVQCLADGDCMSAGTGFTCNTTSHQCQPPGCPPPTESCTNGSQSMNGCANAKIIGRTKAAASGGYTDSTDNCSRTKSTNNTSGCDDDGGENYYRIYMRTGDVIKVSLVTWDTCDFSESFWTAALEIYSNAGCGDTTCAKSAVCKDDSDEPSDTYTATQDGWFIIIVDSYDVDFDEGDYDLTVKLTCKTAGCEC